MKNYKRLIIYIIPLFILSSCIVDDLDVQTTGETLANLYAPSGDSYFFGISTGITIELTFAENPGATITQVNVTKILTTSNGTSAPATFTVTGSTITQTTTELFADVPVNGAVLTENDLLPGDNWEFSYTFTVSTGRELASGDQTTVVFTCLSELAGTWSSVGTGGGGGGNDVIPGPAGCGICWDGTATVTLADIGGGSYSVEDATGGLASLYWGGNNEVGVLTDLCGLLTMPSYGDQWGDINVNTFSLNTDGTISFSFNNSYGDFLNATWTKN